MQNNALLIINLGTPDSPSVKDVEKYLKEFLMDKYVISLPWILRWILVNLIIVPKRKYFSSNNYKKIWDKKNGSPLLFHTKNLANNLKNKTKEYSEVFVAMRYGSPSIGDVLRKLEHYDHVDILPLYPHLTGSSYISAIESVKAKIKDQKVNFTYKITPVFYNEDFFISNIVRNIHEAISQTSTWHFIFSYHGIPVNHLKPSCNDFNDNCCLSINERNKNCYRAQCFETSRLIAAKLNLTSDQFTTAFQSRLGAGRWIGPYLVDHLKQLAKMNKKKIIIISPSFIVDCLETLEELAIEVPKEYLSILPDAEIKYIPCLNDNKCFANDLGSWAYNQD